ncbi:MAG TPA: UDP-N-acetylmuramate dehydrogenase [Candidatus Kaiserbacteria bacterium]|nr:UDP-N-acetylmuramate dehydrogenase [Candidatus Kaiserbacteria bacterium]
MGSGGTHIRFLFGARTRSPYIGGIDILMNIQDNLKRKVILKEFTTFRIGGPADFFVRVQNIKELKEVLIYTQENKLRVFILGGGSNIVFQDDGFRGLVIKIEIKGILYKDLKENEILLEAGGGEIWDDLVSFSVAHGFYGIENLSAIPGTVGATPVQNIGAFGVEVGDFIESVDVIDIKTGKERKFTKKECMFGYRDSFFKTKVGKEYIITRVVFKLIKDGKLNFSYSDISQHFKIGNKTLCFKETRKAIIAIRSKKSPNLDRVCTAGSFFKNPILTNKKYKVLLDMFPDIPSYNIDKQHVKVPLGFILEKLGWKGKKYKNVGIYKKQSLVVVGGSNSTQKELETFAQMIEVDVKNKTGIFIEREVVFVK